MPRQRAPQDPKQARPRAPRRPYMLREISESPERVASLIARETEPLEKALAPFRDSLPPLIFVAGRGTSDNAATFGRYLFEHFLGIPVSGAALSLFTLYPAPIHLRGALAIGISQSGESPDVVKTLRTARRMGAYTIAVTNAAASSLSGVAHHTIRLHARKERSVAATKTYTATLVAMAMICRALGGDLTERAIEELPAAIRTAIACEETIAQVARYYRYAPRFLCLSRGFNYATVREIALKLMETCYVGSAGMSAADFLHGPIAFVEEDTPVMTFVPRGPTYRFMLGLTKRLAAQGVDVLAFTNAGDILKYCALGVDCPLDTPECLTPIPFAALGQLFAGHLALIKGLNPDAPRRLTKVTRTL
ncbi:MAG TPA: SIS domain-containing protein [Armatimonadota bacterium]|nr:SIS domain-containing protein [Armatimonadota bacterium]